MTAGRPREHDREQIAIDIIEWARKSDSINLNKFCAHYEPIIPPTQLSIWSKQCDKFRKAVESAKAFLGYRREEMLNKNQIHIKGYDLNATTYDLILKEERMSNMTFESSLRKSENGDKPTQITIKVDPHGLGAGLKVSTETISNTTDNSSK